MQIELFITN